MRSEEFIPFILYTERISKNIKRIEDKVMKPYGLRSAHVMCLLCLARNQDGLSLVRLADACGVDKAFISRITDELSDKNYIKRNMPFGMRYKSKFVLTQSGKEISRLIEKVISETIDDVTRNISDIKLRIFNEVLWELDGCISEVLKKENKYDE